MRAMFHSRWKKIKQHPVATVLLALLAVVIVLIILSILGYIFNWGWTGLGPYISPPYPKDSTFQRGKTLWDWLQLLIIPAVLAVAGYVINLTISRGEQEATKQRDKTAHEIALDNQRQIALQDYIDKLSELMLHEKLRESQPNDEVRTIARVRTLTVLPGLDGERKGSVLRFLYESGLITKSASIIDLNEANFIGTDLEWDRVNLSGADLKGASFIDANFYDVNLSGADLKGASFEDAYMEKTCLKDADLNNAYLSGCCLSYADLSGAKLNVFSLRFADLSYANLSGAEDITVSELEKQAISLKGATMPDGTIHP
jgi:hypothetical protein